MIHSFLLEFEEDRDLTNEEAKKFFDEMAEKIYATCNDSTISSSNGILYLEFDREAPSLGDAINSAVADVKKLGYWPDRIIIENP